MNRRIGASATPWYREPWPWLLMLGPFLVIIAGLITAWLAVRSADGLVDDDYYKQGLAVNQRIHRDREASARGIEADLLLGGNGRELVARLHEKSTGGAPPMLHVRLSHPTVAGRDISLSLLLGPDGRYRIALSDPLRGRWLVSIEDASSRWRLVGEWNLEKSPELHLAPRTESFSGEGSTQGGSHGLGIVVEK